MGSTGKIRTVDALGLGPVANASLVTQAGGAWATSSINTNGTVEYYLNATQAVTDRDYNNLIITNTGTKTWTLGATRTINGNVTINSSAPLTLSGAQTLNIKGNWSNSGTFTPGSSTILFNGGSTQNIGGSAFTNFNNLSIASGTSVNLGTLSHTANNLSLGGAGTVAGTWGGTGSGAAHINPNYFTTATGKVTVTNGSCANPVAPVTDTNTYTYNGVAKMATATVGIGETVDWYAAATGTTTTTAPTGTNAGTYSAYAEARNTTTGCVSATRALVTLTINKVALTAATTVAPKVYNGSAVTGTVSLGTVSGLIGTETLIITPSASNFADANVGTGKATAISYTLADGTGLAANYSMANLATTGVITKFDVIGSFAADNKVYDSNNSAVVMTGSRSVAVVFAGDDLSLTGGTATFDSRTIGDGKTVTLTGATLAGDDAGNYTLTGVATTTANITPLGISGTFASSNKTFDGNTSAAASDRALVGVITPDAVTLSGGTATFDTRTVGVDKTVTLTGATLAGTDAGNYTLTSVATTTANITPLGITGTFASSNKTFDGNTRAAASDRALVGVISPDAVTLSGGTATFDTRTVGDGKTVTLTGATLAGDDAGNYTLTGVATTTANITALGITGTFTADNKVYNGNAVAAVLTQTLNGVIDPDVVTLTGGSASFSDKDVANGKTVTSSGMSLSGAQAGNYSLTSVGTTTANITKRDLTVTATGINKVYDGNTMASVTLSTNKVSGDDVTASYLSASFDNPNGSIVGVNKPITVNVISISGADATNYNLLNTTATTTANITQASTTLMLTLSGYQVRYMDNLTYTAVIKPLNTGSPLTGSVTFKVMQGSTVITTYTANVVPIPGAMDGSVQAMVINQLPATVIPGSYTVTAMFTSTNTNYSNSNTDSKTLKVDPRDASPYTATGFYVGDGFAWTTGSSTSTATVTMVAAIRDANVLKGDVRGAKVSFYFVNGTTLTAIPSAQNLPVGLIDVTDGSVGTASAIVQLNIGSLNSQSFQIAVKVTGAYTNNPWDALSESIVTVSKPVTGGFITGGSNMTNNQSSSGYIKGATGQNTDFQFDMQYTKSGTNPKGKVNILVRSYYDRTGILDSKLHTYLIRTNAIALLAISTPLSTGTFSAKANMEEQLTDGTVVSVESGATFQMVAFQNACNQQIAITYYRKAGGIWFSSNWDALTAKSVLQPVNSKSQVFVAGGGNCSVSAPAPTARTISPVTTKQAKEIPVEPILFNVIAYPNPAKYQFTLVVEGGSSEKVEVMVYDLLGRTVKHIEQSDGQPILFGEELPVGAYFTKVSQGTYQKTVRLIKQ